MHTHAHYFTTVLNVSESSLYNYIGLGDMGEFISI